jgi:apolipoprotein D and lipocalin family protein
MMSFFAKIFVIIAQFFLLSCQKKIEIPPVSNFEASKYFGKWHEIARTDNKFERGCEDVTAEYSLKQDGGIDVLNVCKKGGETKAAKGVAYFRGEKNIASLKVSFFWPFYGRYDVIYLEDYKYAIVYGGSPKYIWILARERNVSEAKREELLNKIDSFGLNSQTLLLQR